jgi:hypothetical protein
VYMHYLFYLVILTMYEFAHMRHMTQQPILESRPDHGSGRLVSGSGRVGFRLLCVIFGFFLDSGKNFGPCLTRRTFKSGRVRVFSGGLGLV